MAKRWGNFELRRREFLAAAIALGAGATVQGRPTAMSTMPKPIDSCVPLPEGRMLGIRCYGEAEHPPVLYFHGAPSSRVEADVIAEPVCKKNIYLIAVDRPGMGRSTYSSRHNVARWPADVGRLLDALNLGKVGLLSMSSGTPFALACAEKLPDRIERVALMGPRTVGAPGVPNTKIDEALYLGIRRPRLAGLLMNFLVRQAHRNPAVVERVMGSRMACVDQQYIARHRSWFIQCFREGVRCGTAGVLLDLSLQPWPWGVCLANVRPPVRYWRDLRLPCFRRNSAILVQIAAARRRL